MSLHDFAEFIRILNKHRVRYLVIGGYAVAFHGHPRATDDVDVLIARDEENLRRVERAFVDFVGVAPRPDSLRAPRGMVRIGGPVAHIDVTTKVDGLAAFEPLWQRRERGDLLGEPAAYLEHGKRDAWNGAMDVECGSRTTLYGIFPRRGGNSQHLDSALSQDRGNNLAADGSHCSQHGENARRLGTFTFARGNFSRRKVSPPRLVGLARRARREPSPWECQHMPSAFCGHVTAIHRRPGARLRS